MHATRPMLFTATILALTNIASGQTCRQWVYRTNDGPTPRWGPTLTFDASRGVTVLFGGGSPREFSDTWEWNGLEWNELQPLTRPAARSGHTAVYDSNQHRVLMFGGIGNNHRFKDTWAWDGQDWTLLSEDGPVDRYAHAMSFDSNRNVAVLFGGYGLGQIPADTWEFDGSTWTRVAQSGPSRRWNHAMAFDERRGVTVLFGGWAENGVIFNDTWEWDGTSWTMVANDGPRPRVACSMAYDSDRGVIVMYGGLSTVPPSGNLQDTWEWDGSAWTQVNDGLPPKRVSHSMAYDSWRKAQVMFGGQDSQHLNDTWEYRSQPTLSIDSPCPGGGTLHLDWQCTTPDGRIALLYARSIGMVRIPANRPCAGTQLGLGSGALQVVYSGRSDANGAGSISGHIPAGACGSSLQLIDLTNCFTSDVAPIK